MVIFLFWYKLVSILKEIISNMKLQWIGTLTIFLKKTFNLDITTSNYDDEEIEHNIAFNYQANGVVVFPHIRREHFLPSLIVKLFFFQICNFSKLFFQVWNSCSI